MARHADASRVDVALRFDDRAVMLDVRDDGRGLADPGARGNGLTGMEERLTAIGGALAIENLAGGGVRLRARIPREAPHG